MLDRIELSDRTILLTLGEVQGPDGRRQRLTSRERDLLAHLAAHMGQDVSRDALHAEVWGHGPQVLSRACDSAVRRLRTKIERDPAEPRHLLTAHGSGYRLVTASRVPANLPPARPALTPAPTRAAPAQLGDLSVDLDRLVVGGPAGEVALTTGEAALLKVLMDARGAVVDRRRLARASDRQGARAVDAAVRRLRAKLPQPGLIETVRGGGYRLGRSISTLAPPVDDGFIGRAQIQADLTAALLVPGALVSLTGPAGVGKTRLARRTAASHTDAPIWCSLAPVSGGSGAVARALASVLGVDLPSRALPALGRALAALGPRLVVLDNAEHVMDGVVAALGVLRSAAPKARWLLTSQVHSGLPGERVLAVEPLSIDEGVALFTALASGPAGLDPDATQDLVKAHDGLPLAIELAAARAAVLPPAEQLLRLDARLDLLRQRGGPARHQTLRAAIRWSHELAPANAQRALLALALAPAGLRLSDAERLLGHLCPDGADPLEALFELRDRHLIGGEGRVHLLAAIRLFALDALEHSPARDSIEGAYVQVFGVGGVAEQGTCTATFERWQPPEAARAVLAEVENHRAAAHLALRRGELGAAAGAAAVTLACLDLSGPYADGIALAETLLATPGLTTGSKARMHLAWARLGRAADRHPQAITHSEEAAVAAAEAGDRWTELRAHLWTGTLRKDLREGDAAVACWEAAIERAQGHPAIAAYLRGRVAHTQQDLDAATRCYSQAGAAARLAGDVRLDAVTAHLLGWIAWQQGRLGQAAVHYRYADAIYTRAGDNKHRVGVANDLCQVLLEQGELAEFQVVLASALAHHRKVGALGDEGVLYTHKGDAHSRAGEATLAAEAFARGRALLVGEPYDKSRAFLLYREAEHFLRAQDWASARHSGDQALEIFTRLSLGWHAACVRGALAVAVAQQGEGERAAELSEGAVVTLSEIKDPTDLCVALCRRGQVRLLASDRGAAQADLTTAQGTAGAGGVSRPGTPAAEALAELQRALAHGDPARPSPGRPSPAG